MGRMVTISLSNPDLQVDFAAALVQLRDTYLQEALFTTVKKITLRLVDRDLAEFATDSDLALLASKGLRGEIIFATPTILRANPYLLGYYRLLLGYSQKQFYTASTGCGKFKAMEADGQLSSTCETSLKDLCNGLNKASSYLLNSMLATSLTRSFLDDLTLLTLGPQLRGGTNVKIGARGIVLVFDAIKAIVEDNVTRTSTRVIEIVNAASRKVLIEFASDPDIVIREQLCSRKEDYRNIIAIEIKGGTDFSNIHNRIGEAEKSHQKAKAQGFAECWTVVNVDRIDIPTAMRESPSTNRFYRLSQIVSGEGAEYSDFEGRIRSLTGVPSKSKKRKKK
ncbi:MAG: XcyI family restriction endonuclease [Nitrospirota bacterium]|nr:XcyI family restriction endonuclease [Nitrospirota bacterium]